MKKHIIFIAAIATIFLSSCNSSKMKTDLILINGNIYTVDSTFSKAQALFILHHPWVHMFQPCQITR